MRMTDRLFIEFTKRRKGRSYECRIELQVAAFSKGSSEQGILSTQRKVRRRSHNCDGGSDRLNATSADGTLTSAGGRRAGLFSDVR